MAKKELSGWVQQMKFMQRAKTRAEVVTEEQEGAALLEDEHWVMPSAAGAQLQRCVIIMEGDPKPRAGSGRMSFGVAKPEAEKASLAAQDSRSHEDPRAVDGAVTPDAPDSSQNGETMAGEESPLAAGRGNNVGNDSAEDCTQVGNKRKGLMGQLSFFDKLRRLKEDRSGQKGGRSKAEGLSSGAAAGVRHGKSMDEMMHEERNTVSGRDGDKDRDLTGRQQQKDWRSLRPNKK